MRPHLSCHQNDTCRRAWGVHCSESATGGIHCDRLREVLREKGMMGKSSRTCVIGANPRKVRDFADLLNGSGEFHCQGVAPDEVAAGVDMPKPVEVVFLFPCKDFSLTRAWLSALRPFARGALLIDDFSVSRIVLLSALEAGADGILVWPASLREVRQAIRIIARGGTPLPPELTSLLLDRLRNGRHMNTDWHRLPPSEAKLMTFVAEGLANKEIAARLSIEPQSVANRLAALYRRLGVHTAAGAVARALKLGLIKQPGESR